MAENPKTKSVNLEGKREEDLRPFLAENIKKEVLENVKKKGDKATIIENIRAGMEDREKMAEISGKQLYGETAYRRIAREEKESAKKQALSKHLSPAQRERLEKIRKVEGSKLQSETAAGYAQRSESQKSEEAARASAAKSQSAMQEAGRAAVLRARAESLKAQMKSRLSAMAQRERADLDGYAAALVIVAFLTAIGSDLLEIALSSVAAGLVATVLGSAIGAGLGVLSSFIGIVASLVVGFLWWSVGSGDFSGRLKKVGRRTLITLGLEGFLSFMPWLTIECILNLLDLLGFFDNKAGAEIKKVIS